MQKRNLESYVCQYEMASEMDHPGSNYLLNCDVLVRYLFLFERLADGPTNPQNDFWAAPGTPGHHRGEDLGARMVP